MADDINEAEEDDNEEEDGFVQRRGRPSELTPALQAKLLDYVTAGNFLDVAAALSGVDRTTVFRWTKRGARELRRKKKQGGKWRTSEKPFVDFFRAFQRARAEAEARNVANINLVARGQPAREVTRERILPDGTVERTVEKVAAIQAQWTASAWYLERTQRERWGRPTRSEQARGLSSDSPPVMPQSPVPLAEHTEESVLSIVGELAERAQKRIDERAAG